MSQQLWRLDNQTKAAVLQHKREQRHVAELKRDLADFRKIFSAPIDDRQRSWADQMIKSIEHELDEIKAGRATAPDSWEG